MDKAYIKSILRLDTTAANLKRYLMKYIEILNEKNQKVIGIIYLVISTLITLTIPRFKIILTAILQGDKLPAITSFIMITQPYLWIVCGYIPGLFLILSNKKELDKPIVKACFIAFLIILLVLTVVSFFLPLIVTIKKLGG